MNEEKRNPTCPLETEDGNGSAVDEMTLKKLNRRRFMQVSGALASAAAVAPVFLKAGEAAAAPGDYTEEEPDGLEEADTGK